MSWLAGKASPGSQRKRAGKPRLIAPRTWFSDEIKALIHDTQSTHEFKTWRHKTTYESDCPAKAG